MTQTNLDRATRPTSKTFRTIKFLFDPSQLEGDPISIVPDPVQIDPRQAGVELVLATVGDNGQEATFPASGFITWGKPGPLADAARAVADADRLRLRLPLLTPRPGVVKYPYHVSAEYGGRLYTSTGYPAMEVEPPVDDPAALAARPAPAVASVPNR